MNLDDLAFAHLPRIALNDDPQLLRISDIALVDIGTYGSAVKQHPLFVAGIDERNKTLLVAAESDENNMIRPQPYWLHNIKSYQSLNPLINPDLYNKGG